MIDALVHAYAKLWTNLLRSRENVAYGKLDATNEEIEHAARQVHMGSISELLFGYETQIGERGSSLPVGKNNG